MKLCVLCASAISIGIPKYKQKSLQESVIPAKAGIQVPASTRFLSDMDPGFRRDDSNTRVSQTELRALRETPRPLRLCASAVSISILERKQKSLQESVIPAKAGIQVLASIRFLSDMDPGFRRDDSNTRVSQKRLRVLCETPRPLHLCGFYQHFGTQTEVSAKSVIPAKAGIQVPASTRFLSDMDPGFRRDDSSTRVSQIELRVLRETPRPLRLCGFYWPAGELRLKKPAESACPALHPIWRRETHQRFWIRAA